MPKLSPYARSVARSAVVLAAILWCLADCNNTRSAPPRARRGSAQPESERPKAQKDLKYRTESGSPIAPVVVPDNPLPMQLQPVTDQPAGTRSTLNGDPNGLTRDTLNRSIQGAMGSFAACFSSLTQDPMVSVSFEADPSGRPSLVRVGGAPPDAERCVRNVVQGIRFPSFEGKGVQVDLPLSFHRVARPTQAGSRAGGQQPGPAPLFLQP